MNDKTKLLAGILVFGSLWGFSECIIGPKLSGSGLPSGVIMTGIFAMIFLTMSRLLYRERGMQIGMGLTAGALRLFNPFGGCHVCSALAIMAEGMIFELIWTYATDLDLKNLKSLTMKTSLGIFTAYCVYVGGYMITQILTPLSYGKFYFENLLALTPQIFASGLLVALIGGVTIPAVLSIRKIDLTIKDALYYPATLGISVLCWLIVVGNYMMLA